MMPARLLIQIAILLMLATDLSAQIISRKAYVITNDYLTVPRICRSERLQIEF